MKEDKIAAPLVSNISKLPSTDHQSEGPLNALRNKRILIMRGWMISKYEAKYKVGIEHYSQFS